MNSLLFIHGGRGRHAREDDVRNDAHRRASVQGEAGRYGGARRGRRGPPWEELTVGDLARSRSSLGKGQGKDVLARSVCSLHSFGVSSL